MLTADGGSRPTGGGGRLEPHEVERKADELVADPDLAPHRADQLDLTGPYEVFASVPGSDSLSARAVAACTHEM